MSFILQNIKNMMNEHIKHKKQYNIVDIDDDNEPDIEQVKKDSGQIISKRP